MRIPVVEHELAEQMRAELQGNEGEGANSFPRMTAAYGASEDSFSTSLTRSGFASISSGDHGE